MYEISEKDGVITLFNDGEVVNSYMDYKEMAYELLSEMEFVNRLYYPDGENPIFGDLALAKQAYPEMRMGQLIVNAISEQRTAKPSCRDCYYASDEELTQGLRKLFEAKLIPFEEVKKKLYAED